MKLWFHLVFRRNQSQVRIGEGVPIRSQGTPYIYGYCLGRLVVWYSHVGGDELRGETLLGLDQPGGY